MILHVNKKRKKNKFIRQGSWHAEWRSACQSEATHSGETTGHSATLNLTLVASLRKRRDLCASSCILIWVVENCTTKWFYNLTLRENTTQCLIIALLIFNAVPLKWIQIHSIRCTNRWRLPGQFKMTTFMTFFSFHFNHLTNELRKHSTLSYFIFGMGGFKLSWCEIGATRRQLQSMGLRG